MTSPGSKNMAEHSPREMLEKETAAMIEETTTMIGEVSKVLQVRRWEVREEPFAGFRSPPGRF